VSIDDGAGMSAPVDSGPGLSDHPLAVAHALARLDSDDARTIEDMCAIAAIAAPTGGEQQRAEWFRVSLAAIGLDDVDTDAVGNVVGWWPAPLQPGLPPVVVAAHLDTVFDSDAPLEVVREGRLLRAPGIADNTRGLAALLAIARALASSDWRSTHPLALVATVGEEGAGDLRGAKYLLRDGSEFRGASAFVALDGTGRRQIVHRAVGSIRLRFEADGPGGHSWADQGMANPLLALASGAAALADPDIAGATVTVTRFAGGRSVNAIPAAAWLEVDIRALESAALRRAAARVRSVITRAIRYENDRRRPGTKPLELAVSVIGERPTGCTPLDSTLVQAADAATRQLGLHPEHVAASTDANVALSLGMPAIALGAGGRSGGTHTASEWYDNEGGVEGLQRVLLTLTRIAGGS
jgi:tripeptide aminopeptidase